MSRPVVPVARSRRTWLAPFVAALLVIAALAVPAGVAAAEYRDCSSLQLAPGARLHRCALPGLVIIGQDLHGIDFSKSDLTGLVGGCDPDLPRTNLAGARIARAILAEALLCDAILTDADLHGTDFSGAAFEDASLNRANLSWARLDGAAAGFAPFIDANLSNASWVDGSAIGARFDGADLHRIDLRGTDLRSAKLPGADLRYARLDGVDFTMADLSGVDWRRSTGAAAAIFSDTTCPDGTNSDANGGTCAGH
ncbi:MAG: pentapeptide repeat-containing protein [Candidatus Limnocylindrales bacterium]